MKSGLGAWLVILEPNATLLRWSDESLGADLLPRVEAVIRRHAMLHEGDGVVVACSGGPDSLALLGLLSQLREQFHIDLTAVYVNHGLRPEAEAEGEFVKQQAATWGIRGRVCVVEQDLHAGNGSVQALARAARYQLLHQMARDLGATRIAVGHTADDQAETLVMRFLRGTGTQGLGGIPPVNGIVIRPLLYTGRADTEAYCLERGLTPVTDPSNLKDDYARNQIRHHLMPVLSEYNPQLKEVLLRLSDVVRCDNEWMEEEASHFLHLHAQSVDQGVWCRKSPLLLQPLALQRRLIRSLVRQVRCSEGYLGQEVEFAHVEAVLDLLKRGVTGNSLPLPGGVQVIVERNGLWVGPVRSAPSFEVEAPVPGDVILPSGLRVIVTMAGGAGNTIGELHHNPLQPDAPWQASGRQVLFDCAMIRGRLSVRNRHAGDRYQPAGMQGEKKLQDIFVDEGIPRRWRDRLPVFTDEDGVVWVPGSRPAHRVQVTPDTVQAIKIELASED